MPYDDKLADRSHSSVLPRRKRHVACQGYYSKSAAWSSSTKLKAADRAGNDGFGRSVAVEGSTVAAGAPLDDRFHADAAQVRVSLRKLAGLDTSLLLPGHGEPWSGSIDDALVLAG